MECKLNSSVSSSAASGADTKRKNPTIIRVDCFGYVYNNYAISSCISADRDQESLQNSA